MAQLLSGYVITPEMAIKIAENLGIYPAKDKYSATAYINKYLKEKNPRFPRLRGIDYPSFSPKRQLAFMLATRVDDDNPKAKFKERPLDLRIKQVFMKVGGLEEGDLNWDTVVF